MLPCGREINQNYQNDDCHGENIECCHTVCPNKTWEEIDNCYESFNGVSVFVDIPKERNK